MSLFPTDMTAKDVVECLRQHYTGKNDGQWAFFEELRVGTGYGKGCEQRLDAYALGCYPSKGHTAIAFEVKVSRSDFLAEIRNPAKRYHAMALSNQFFFVAPEGLVTTEEIPDLCGLMEVTEEGFVRIKKHAERRVKLNPTWTFVASICRRVAREELQEETS